MPIWALAMTFDHGAGVVRPGPSERTYSRPSGVKPPRPLKNNLSRGGGSDSVTGSSARVLALVEAYERFRDEQGLPASWQVVYGVLRRGS